LSSAAKNPADVTADHDTGDNTEHPPRAAPPAIRGDSENDHQAHCEYGGIVVQSPDLSAVMLPRGRNTLPAQPQPNVKIAPYLWSYGTGGVTVPVGQPRPRSEELKQQCRFSSE
jgi:hypothetical protein